LLLFEDVELFHRHLEWIPEQWDSVSELDLISAQCCCSHSLQIDIKEFKSESLIGIKVKV
jgi:hypothetical protein